MYPASAGGLLSTEPPGKSQIHVDLLHILCSCVFHSVGDRAVIDSGSQWSGFQPAFIYLFPGLQLREGWFIENIFFNLKIIYF